MLHSRTLLAILMLPIATAKAETLATSDSSESDSTAAAAMAEIEAGFGEHVSSILQRNCAACHAGEAAEVQLDLTSAAAVLQGSESGPVIAPGNAEQSLLWQVLDEDAELHMPPDGQLGNDEIAAIADWLDSLPADVAVGATAISDEDRRHWAFRPIERPDVPIAASNHVRSPIDAFVMDRLDERGLEPSVEADRATLLRRVYLDLIGLAPTPEQMAEFLADERPDAYERTVDRLLASPAYGQRWGRHWLDLARYADTSGYHNDFDRPHAWRYRDYVIDSFNADVPYGDFIRQQVAGDELDQPSLESWVATGFNRHGPTNNDNMGSGLMQEKYRLDELDDIISTITGVFLGLTVACARCHDHKYDPISIGDYYRFLAIFDNTQRLDVSLDDFSPEQPQLTQPSRDNSQAAAMVLTDSGRDNLRATRLLWRGDVRNPGPEVSPGIPEVLADDRGPTFESRAASGEPLGLRRELAEWIAAPENPLTWRVMANRLWHYHFGRGLVATPSNFGRLGDRSTHPELLEYLAAELRDQDSLKSLHRMIVTSATYRQSSDVDAGNPAAQRDPDNLLLWRMNKQRLEAESLRDAILQSAGTLNRAVGGPGVKPRVRPELLTSSQRNKWPHVQREGPEHWRRSVYVYVKRQLQLPLLDLFDAPTTTHSCDRREQSLVPTQALVLMNDDFVRQQAAYFADRVRREAGEDRHDQIRRALEIALARPATEHRVEQGAAFLASQQTLLEAEGIEPDEARRQALADLCQVLINLSEFLYVD